MCYYLYVALRVEEYVREDGSIPYRTWFDGKEGRDAAGESFDASQGNIVATREGGTDHGADS